MATRGVNKTTIVGNLGDEPRFRRFPDGQAVCNVTVATTEIWKDKETGEVKKSTEWHRIVFKNRNAEIASEYLKKGSKIYVEGKLKTRKWTTDTGIDHYITEIHGYDMQMLDSAPQSQQKPEAKPQAPKEDEPVQQAANAPVQKAPPISLDDLDGGIEFDPDQPF